MLAPEKKSKRRNKMAERYIKALNAYADRTDDLTQRIIQDRTLHMHSMNEAYMQALAGGEHPEYISMLEQAIGERSIYNDRKMILDAGDLTVHDHKVAQALGHNSDALSGGGLVDTSPSAMRGLEYAVKRSNAMHASFNKKLQQDRQMHLQELEALFSVTPSNGATKSVLASMVAGRNMDNQSRIRHDAKMWANLDSNVAELMGGGSTARRVLAHGVENSIIQSGQPSLPLTNPKAAELWSDILGSSEGISGGFY